MNRRNFSPIRNIQNMNPEIPQRQLIIKKLKDDLITGREREKEYQILKNYKLQLEEKVKQLEAQKIKTDGQRRSKKETSNQAIAELKKQLQKGKNDQKSLQNDYKDENGQQDQLRKKLNIKNVEIIQRRKQAAFLQAQHQRIIQQKYRILNEEESVRHQYQRFRQTLNNKEDELNEVNLRIPLLKKDIQDEKSNEKILVDKLRKYENENNNISEKIQIKGENLQELQQNFSQKYQDLRKQSQNLIQLEYRLQKIKKQTQYKLHLFKNQNDKTLDYNNRIKKTQKTQYDALKQKKAIDDQCVDIQNAAVQIQDQNKQFKIDLAKCQTHLDNLFKQNVTIQEELQNYIRQDEAIINLIQRKKILPTLEYMRTLRSSRAIKNSRMTGI